MTGMGHTLYGRMPRQPEPERPCIWCRKPTDITFDPTAMPHLGPQPLHMFCAAALIRAFERWQRGQVLSARDMERLRALAQPPRQLEAG